MVVVESLLKRSIAVLIAVSMLVGLLVVVSDDAAALPSDAWITGNVTDGVDPVPNAYVKVMIFASESIDVGYGFTDASGDYSIEVPAGFNYVVLVANGSYMMGFEPASVLPGQTKWVNFTLTPISLGADVTIKGKILDSVGDPVTDGHILSIVNGPAGTDSTPVYANITEADDIDGSYELKVIPGDYGGGVVAMDVPGYSMIENTTDEYPLVSGGTYWFNITVTPPSYADDAMIYGYVTDKDTGDPLENVLVSVETSNQYMEDGRYSNFTYTDDQGYYEINVVNGSASIMMMKAGYSMATFNDADVPNGGMVVQDAELVQVNCIVRGNVTDLKTDTAISLARVFISDGISAASMAMTNSSGGYELYCFDGDNLWIGAEAEQYSRNETLINLAPGEETWKDFGLVPATSWLEGNVTDKTDGSVIEGASVSARSSVYEDRTDTDASGYYNISVAAGTYEVTIGADNYVENSSEVDVLDEATKVHDVALYPRDMPKDCRLYGWVNDSGTLTGIQPAFVIVRNDDADLREEAWTGGDGYYEMYIPQVAMEYGVNAWQHYPEYGSLDATSMLEMRMDVLLDSDAYRPNITFSQSPVENITWFRPTVIDAEFEDPNLREMTLTQSRYWKTEGTVEHYYLIDEKRTSFDPFEPTDSLPYVPSVMDDNYTIYEEWNGTASAGWLENSTDSYYLMAYEIRSPILYYGLGGVYNDPYWTDQQVLAIFDGETGECLMFHPGWDDPIYPDEPFGTFEPMIEVMTFDLSDWSSADRPDYVRLDAMNATELMFTPDSIVPSGDYRTVFRAEDFGWQSNGFITNLTVDNDPPVADAGGDRNAVVNTTVELNGTGSDDNVGGGIVSYVWDFVYDGTPVQYTTEVAEHEFTELGIYILTLTVTDGAGHVSTDTVNLTIAPDAPPVANPGPDMIVDEDTVVVFDGSASTDDNKDIIENYTWTIVELSVELYGVSPEFTFDTPDVYTVELVVNDTIGQLSLPGSMTVTVEDVTDPIAIAGLDMSVPSDSTVTLNGSLSSDNVGVVIYNWTFMDDGAQVVLIGEAVDYVFSNVGDIVVTLTVDDAAGNSDTDELTVTVLDATDPVADAGPDQSVEAGEEVTFDGGGSSDNVLVVSWTWTFVDDGDDITRTGESPTYTFDNSGEFVVTLTVEDAAGNSDEDTVTIRVNSPPVADAGVAITVTVGATVTFDGSDSSDDVLVENYTWTFAYDGDVETLYGVAPSFTFEIAGNYTVTLVVEDASGLTDTDTVVVNVEEDSTAEDKSFLEEYWWLLVVIGAVVAAVAAAAALMKSKKGAGGAPEEPAPEELEDLPPPPDDGEL